MKHIRKALLTVLCLVCAPLITRAERLEAVWIGPDGSGREGDWHTPSHWNLGVVPNNGTDGNGDGVPDTFNVWIDQSPPATAAHNTTKTIEVAGLNLGEDDGLNLEWPGNLVLRDVDSIVEIVNDGVIRLGGIHVVEPRLSFAGETLRFSGDGVVDIGTQTARPAILAGLDNGRIINGPGHTLRVAGRLYAGRIAGFVGNETSRNLALTNEGVITSEERGAGLSVRLNSDSHFNSGTIQAVDGAQFSISSQKGTLFNSGLIVARDGGDLRLFDTSFVNETAGVVRAVNDAAIEFHVDPDQQFENRGLVEAIGAGGRIVMSGKQLDNQGGGVVRASSGGAIMLAGGAFRPDPAIQIADQDSYLVIQDGAVFENEGNVLSAGPGTLIVDGRGSERALVRGGEITSGQGEMTLISALLEDLTLSGTASGIGNRADLKGTITVSSGFTAADIFDIQLTRGDAVLRGPGVSRFTAPASFDATNFTFEIAADHRVETSSLNLRGTVLVNGQLDAAHVDVDGILAGAGSVKSEFDIRVGGASAAISPGNGIGTLSLGGDVHFYSGSLIAELGGDSSDLLSITGNLWLTLDDNLLLSGGLVGQSYVIAEFTGERYGEFDNVTPGYNVIYDDLARQIRVEPIPEPASVALAIAGLMAVALGRWRKNR